MFYVNRYWKIKKAVVAKNGCQQGNSGLFSCEMSATNI